MKAKDINIYNIFSKTYNDRPMFSFVGFEELSLMPKVKKPIKQVSNVWQFPIEQYYKQKRRVK
tara:strand:+ start:646 stop:834 length:189 start_codon:yes stop_codon:yes gene_type:complete